MVSIEKTMEALKKNKMAAYYAENREEAKKIALSLIEKGAVCASGGSVTLTETGIIDALKGEDYRYIDRYASDLTPEERVAAMEKAMHADVYLSSANAITEKGEIYNVDGNSNRVSALLYGPKSVIIVAGINKLVENLDAAVTRVKTITAPKNAARLSCDTPCAKTGHCIAVDGGMTDGCASPARICCNFTVMAQQRHVERVKVILVGEELGY